MSEKVTLEFLKNYATEFCAITLAKAYSQKETLNGHDLLQLTPVKKINQHIVGRLSAHWNNQIQNFSSPYFDFNAGEVKSALEHFSNVVSQHISLRREHLQPWLQDVVEKTLAPLASVTTLSDADENLINLFSSVHPLVLSIPKPVEEAAAPAPVESRSVSFFRLAEDENEEPEVVAPAREIKAEVDETPAVKSEPAPIVKPAEPVITEKPTSLNNRFQVETPQYSPDVTYGSVKLKLENIGQSISLAQRFMFVGQLFKGDFEAFSQSISALDNAPDYAEAHRFVTETLASKYGWDIKGEAVSELITLVKRKFN